MNRRYFVPVALALIALTAGCMGFGSGPIPDEDLDAEPAEAYAWDADTDVHIVVQENSKFRGVYELEESEIELYRRDGFGGRSPLSVEAVRYRYPNGSVITGSELEARGGSVERTRDEVTVTLPSDAPPGGRLAFTADSTPKRFTLPTFVEGSYEVVLPPDRRIEVPILGSASPRGHSAEVVDGQTRIRWDEVTADSVVVQFYLQRDLYIFGAIALALVVVGGAGGLYYRRQIRRLREQREELGLDVDTDDDEGRRGPPPGMG